MAIVSPAAAAAIAGRQRARQRDAPGEAPKPLGGEQLRGADAHERRDRSGVGRGRRRRAWPPRRGRARSRPRGSAAMSKASEMPSMASADMPWVGGGKLAATPPPVAGSSAAPSTPSDARRSPRSRAGCPRRPRRPRCAARRRRGRRPRRPPVATASSVRARSAWISGPAAERVGMIEGPEIAPDLGRGVGRRRDPARAAAECAGRRRPGSPRAHRRWRRPAGRASRAASPWSRGCTRAPATSRPPRRAR